MAADATLANGLLSVQGTDSSDHIVVSEGFNGIQVTINDFATGNVRLQRTFMTSLVRSIKVQCLGGDDIAENNTSKPSTMYGGAGGDVLYGGSAGDILYSASTAGGTDTGTNALYGNGGNDTLRGGSAVDHPLR